MSHGSASSHWVRRVLSAAALTAAIAIAAPGCQQKPAQAGKVDKDNSQLAAKAPTEGQQPVEQQSPSNALAEKINQYSQELAKQLAQSRAADAAAQANGDPSQVQFMKPGANVALAPTTKPASKPEPEPKVVPLAQPVVDAQPSSANQSVAIATPATMIQGGATGQAMGQMRLLPDELSRTVVAPKPALPAADLEAKLARHIQDYPRDLWAHLDYQLLHFLRDEQTPQLDALTALPLEDRELIATVMDGLTNFRNTLRADGNTLLSRKIKPLLELSDRLRSQADLNIPVATLCTNVDGFGVYEPISPSRFLAGKEHQAIVYCEVENFSSAPVSDKQLWETKLAQEAVLYTESGMPVWVDKSGAITDRSRNRRHDFFLVKKIKLPAQLTIGRYLLKVTVEDQQAKRVAEQTIPIEIVAQVETSPAPTASAGVVGK